MTMMTVTHTWNQFWDYFRQGLPHINIVLGVVIALVGGMMVGSLPGLAVIALLAVAIHVLSEAVIPMVLHSATFTLPAMNDAFLHYAISLYIAYFVVIGAIYIVRLIFSGGRTVGSRI
jgi:hypothetical protein